MASPTGEWSKLDWLKSNEPGGQRAAPGAGLGEPVAIDPIAQLRLTYRPNPAFMLLCVIICTAIGLGLWHIAATNDRGMLIEGLIRLSTPHATLVLWVLSALTLAGAALGLLLGVPRSFLKPEVVLDDDSIILPVYRPRLRHERLQFRHIRQIKRTQVHRQKFIRLYYDGGSRTLNVNWLPDPADEEAILTWIAQRLEGKQQGGK